MEQGGYQEKKIVYFNKIGLSNTEDVLRLSRERFEELGLKRCVVATSFGVTALKALDYYKPEELCIVNSMYGFRKPGIQSLDEDTLKKLQDAGVTLVYQTHVFAGLDRSINRLYGGITPTQLIGQIFKLIGEGFKVCCEIVVMAADAGGVGVDEEVMSIGGSWRGADTAVVLVPVHSNNFFDLQFKEFVCLPRTRSLKHQPI